MTITKTTRLLPARETRIRIKVDDPASLTWGIRTLSLAEGHERAIIDWGDGSRTEVTADGAQEHAYAQIGEYEVRISDDLASLCFSAKAGSSVYRTVYAPMIRAFRSTATLIDQLANGEFANAVNLSAFSCAGSGVRSVAGLAFSGCASLVGRLDLPDVESIADTSLTGCTGITELHFSAANEETIRALSGYDTHFGATNAEVVFDL